MMSEVEVIEKGPAINPADNLSGWLDAREAKGEPAAEPEVVPETTQPASWRDVVLPDDVGHEFLKGKKVGDAITSWEHSQRALKEAQREAAEAKRELEAERRRIEAETAARKVQSEAQPAKPQSDPDAEIETLLLENPRLGIKALRERMEAEADKRAEAKLQAFKQENEQQRYVRDKYEAGGRAYDSARQALNLDEATWNKRSKAVLLELTDERSAYYEDGQNIFRPEKYVEVYKELYGDSQQAPIVVKPATEPPTPPGAKRPSNVNVAEPTASPLTRERLDAIKTFAGIGGVDAKALAARQEKRKRG
jgi:hypothetical protein